MKKYLAELTGTFAMVFCGTGAIIVNEVSSGSITHVGISLTFGLIVMAMIFSLGNISGAHFNPAVTLAFVVAGKFPRKEILPYVSFQLAGAFLASIILRFLFPSNLFLGATIPAGTDFQSFILELILTFFLMFVILNVSHGSKETGTMAGIAIGATVLLDALFGGPVSGASMNPARSIAPAIVSGHIKQLWIYIAAPLAGALLAVLLFHFIKPETE